jgi:PAS domain S-box-containing protein
MVLLRLDGTRLLVSEANQTASEILGVPSGDLEGQDWAGLLATRGDLGEVAADIVAGHGEGWRGEVGLHRDPHVRVSVSLAPLTVRDGSPRFTAQMVDTTAQHEATLRMRSEMDFTSAILDTAGCLIVVVGVDGTVVGLNRAAQAITGFHDGDVVDRPLWDRLIPEADRDRVRQMFAAPHGSGVPLTQEADLATRSGRKRRVQWSSAFLTDEHGEHTHVVMTGIDVTNERTTSGMLDHLLKAATTTAFIGCDLEGRITTFNRGAQNMLGYLPEEILGRNAVGTILDPAEVGDAPLDDPSRPVTRDWTVSRRDGSTFVMSLTVTRVLDGTDEHIGYLGVGKDVTEQRRSEATLVAALDKERQAVEQLQALDRATDPARTPGLAGKHAAR